MEWKPCNFCYGCGKVYKGYYLTSQTMIKCKHCGGTGKVPVVAFKVVEDPEVKPPLRVKPDPDRNSLPVPPPDRRSK